MQRDRIVRIDMDGNEHGTIDVLESRDAGHPERVGTPRKKDGDPGNRVYFEADADATCAEVSSAPDRRIPHDLDRFMTAGQLRHQAVSTR